MLSILSPHIAGVTEETTRGMAMQVTAEMLRVLRGERRCPCGGGCSKLGLTNLDVAR